MSKFTNKPWYPDHRLVFEKVDRWVSFRRPRPDVSQESDWLGWDAWVRTDEVPKRVSR